MSENKQPQTALTVVDRLKRVKANDLVDLPRTIEEVIKTSNEMVQVDRLMNVTISTQEERREAASHLANTTRWLGRIKDNRLELTKVLRGLVDVINKGFKPAEDVGERVKKYLSRIMYDFETAERKRIAAENAARAKKEQELRDKQIEEVKSGKADPGEVQMATVEREADLQKVEGVTSQVTWKWELMDIVPFVKWVAEDPEVRSKYIDIKRGPMTAMVKKDKDKVVIPGIRVWGEGGTRTTGKAAQS